MDSRESSVTALLLPPPCFGEFASVGAVLLSFIKVVDYRQLCLKQSRFGMSGPLVSLGFSFPQGAAECPSASSVLAACGFNVTEPAGAMLCNSQFICVPSIAPFGSKLCSTQWGFGRWATTETSFLPVAHPSLALPSSPPTIGVRQDLKCATPKNISF